MNTPTDLNPSNVIANLKELQSLTGDENGAQRVAWTPTWDTARGWLAEKLNQLPVKLETDQAGNTWATLKGRSPKALVMGSHIDSVVNGGWLDGCLGVVAALEILRRQAAAGIPPVTIRLVSWADEEGSRFGHSLIGSGAVCGILNPQDLNQLTDKEGIPMTEALGRYGVSIGSMGQASQQSVNAAAYLELHIEQGPVLESLGLPLGAVLGTLGVQRHVVRFTGQTAHSGSTPMNMRRDALAAAARLELEIREIARRHEGVCTIGSVVTYPGIPTAVVGQCDVMLDQRCLDPEQLSDMLREAQEASYRFGAVEKVDVVWKKIFAIEPVAFHPALVELAKQAILEASGTGYSLPSGPLHDASCTGRAGIPTAMIFVQSLNGLSHTREEDTREEDLILGIRAFDHLVQRTVDWIQGR
jgi:N-carbamoyl-L-amino-acid hydrolase